MAPTSYLKILNLKTKEGVKDFPIDEVLETLKPYCIYDEAQKELYRNREKMVSYIKENFLKNYED